MLVPLPPDQIELDSPIPVAIWDGQGNLLLRSGESVRNERERDLLYQHGPHVRASEYKAWLYGYTTQLDRLLRSGSSLNDIARTRLPADFRRMTASDENVDPVTEWPDLHTAVTHLHRQTTSLTDLLQRVDHVEQRMRTLLHADPDRSLFMLVSLLQDTQIGFSAAHALATAAGASLIAQTLDLPATEQQALHRAALTMNIGISRLLDERANRPLPATPAQQQALIEHPLRSMLLLHRLGVTDTVWLDLVRDHHEMPDGSGFPARKRSLPVIQQLLRLSDAMFEHHSQRPGMTTVGGNLPAGARCLMLDDAGQPHAMGTAWLRKLGLYLPGSVVQLTSGEVAVVVRRGAKATTPKVLSLVSRQGTPLGEPIPRDCADPEHEVRSVVPRTSVKVIVDPRRLLARI
jgi:hypothetical protein